VIRGDVRPLVRDLDRYPFPDYSAEQHYVLSPNSLVPMTSEVIGRALTRYQFMTSRGCPFGCTFCCNAALRSLYKGHGPYVRKRSVPNVIAELVEVKNRFPQMRETVSIDDTLFVRPLADIAEFARQYREQVGLPLKCQAHPAEVTREKVDLLTRAGMVRLEVGVQNVSQWVNDEVYKRRQTQEQVRRAIEVLADFRDRVTPHFDYIVSNPLETRETRAENMRFIARHHRAPCSFSMFPMIFYPGSELHERAREAGHLADMEGSVYRRRFGGRHKYAAMDYTTVMMTFVAWLVECGAPNSWVCRIAEVAGSSAAARLFDGPWAGSVCAFARWLYRALIFRPFLRHRETQSEQAQYARNMTLPPPVLGANGK